MDNSGRINREKEFHDHRFSEDSRAAQEKYYVAVSDGNAAYRNSIASAITDRVALEYGCGDEAYSILFSENAKKIFAIDISAVAIDKLNDIAKRKNINNVEYRVMNCEKMEFTDGQFDLIYGSGIIHHLDLNSSYSEISRCLKKGGKAIFWEPLGHNTFINLYRMFTPSARTVDEHPLVASDLKLLEKYFSNVKYTTFGLFTLFSVPFRSNSTFGSIFSVLKKIDKIILKLPFLRYQAWFVLIEVEK